MTQASLPRTLTIAGSDSGGGAGIQADLKTFERFATFGMSALTLVTAQNTVGVTAIELLPVSLIRAQVDAVVDDLGVDATKIGALGSVEAIEAVAHLVRTRALGPVVLDPVMISKHGVSLLAADAVSALKSELLPHVDLITPNLHEAEALIGAPITCLADMERAARDLAALGAKAVVLKAGGLRFDESTDVLYVDGHVLHLHGARLNPRAAHGTGCTFSAAITARLAHGDPLPEAVATAKAYITRAILAAPALGKGCPPVLHSA